jgi:hypothetical protein
VVEAGCWPALVVSVPHGNATYAVGLIEGLPRALAAQPLGQQLTVLQRCKAALPEATGAANAFHNALPTGCE